MAISPVMIASESTIHLIDDDASVRRALGRLMTHARLKWQTHDSAESFLASARTNEGGCIVADLTLPGISGLELKRMLDSARVDLPLILLTAHDSEEVRTAARAAGAAAYFRKPVDMEALLDAIRWALQPASAHPGTSFPP
jgi:FixJ family two-component response regulator